MNGNQDTLSNKVKCPACGELHDPRFKTSGTNKREDIKGNIFTKLNGNGNKKQWSINEFKHQFVRKGFGEAEIEVLRKIHSEMKQKWKNDTVWVNEKLHETRAEFIRVPEAVQVHHLIGIAVVGGTDAKFDEKWFRICFMLGYNINCAQNAVVLPSDMLVACHYKVPLHKGGHDATEMKEKQGRKHIIVQECYSALVEEKVAPLKAKYLNKLKDKKCADIDPKTIKNFHKEMFDISQLSFKNIRKFKWFISADAEHYRPGELIGCYNLCRSIDGKMIEMAKDAVKKVTENTRARDFFFKNNTGLTKGCPDGRDHFVLGCRDKKDTPVKWKEAHYDVMITDDELGIK